MSDEKKEVIRGLEGVSAAETAISYVDGVQGNLYYQGYNIHELAEQVSYDETVYLLWHGELPTSAELRDFRALLVGEMRLPGQVVDLIRLTPDGSHPMDVLRTAVSMLGMCEPDAGDISDASTRRKGLRLIAQIPTVIADLHRVRSDLPVLSPDPARSLAANFLYMFRGEPCDAEEEAAMDLLLMLHVDHGLNASTFAARVTASTQAGIHAAVTSAIGTLQGPLHGGANQRVMEMLDTIGHVDAAQEYIEGMLAEGERVMGFGHRVYKTEDPRARHLRVWSERLCRRANQAHLYEISHRIEEVVMKEKEMYPNVDFYSGTVQHALGIPKEFFTAVFAASRVAGWTAHIREQYADNRLIRPTSKYTGGFDRKFQPIGERP